MEAAIQALSETLTGFLGVDATGAIEGDDDDEPALVTRLNEVAGAAAEAFAASTATPPVLRSPTALGMWEFGNAADGGPRRRTLQDRGGRRSAGRVR